VQALVAVAAGALSSLLVGALATWGLLNGLLAILGKDGTPPPSSPGKRPPSDALRHALLAPRTVAGAGAVGREKPEE
jgi:hypothetical protein